MLHCWQEFYEREDIVEIILLPNADLVLLTSFSIITWVELSEFKVYYLGLTYGPSISSVENHDIKYIQKV